MFVMAVTALSILGFFGCAFVFALVQWLRETNRKPTRRSPRNSGTDDSNEAKRAIVIRFPSALPKHDQSIPASGGVGPLGSQRKGSDSKWIADERSVCHRIVESLGSRRRA